MLNHIHQNHIVEAETLEQWLLKVTSVLILSAEAFFLISLSFPAKNLIPVEVVAPDH